MNEQLEMNFRTRNEVNFRNRQSKDGIINCKLSKEISARVWDYCKRNNLNKTRFVDECVRFRLDVLEREYYESLEKSDLVDLLLKK